MAASRPNPRTVRKRARRRLKRPGKRVSRSAFKARKAHRGQAMIGEPRRWLARQMKA